MSKISPIDQRGRAKESLQRSSAGAGRMEMRQRRWTRGARTPRYYERGIAPGGAASAAGPPKLTAFSGMKLTLDTQPWGKKTLGAHRVECQKPAGENRERQKRGKRREKRSGARRGGGPKKKGDKKAPFSQAATVRG